MIKYIGSKRTMVDDLCAVVGALDGVRDVLDLFAGTSRVGHALKRAGYRVDANDHNAYALAQARCYVAADREKWLDSAQQLLAELSRLPPSAGYVTETFCEKARFFHPDNGARIDAIREGIAKRSLDPELEAVLLVALMEAADRVDSTCGLQMAFLKQWAPRALRPLELRMPDLAPRVLQGACRAFGLDAFEAATRLSPDVAYLDPPYNQHSYLGNYHVWETLVRWDKPATFGLVQKRVDVKTRKSPFNRRTTHHDAFAKLVAAVNARAVVVSFNDEGFLSLPDAYGVLAQHGEVEVLAKPFKRYVGAQIGVHNLQGERVGTATHLANREFVFVLARTGEGLSLDKLRDQARKAALGGLERVSPDALDVVRGPSVPELVERFGQLVERGPVTRKEAAASIGADEPTMSLLVRRMLAEGRLAVTGKGRGTRYVAPEGSVA